MTLDDLVRLAQPDQTDDAAVRRAEVVVLKPFRVAHLDSPPTVVACEGCGSWRGVACENRRPIPCGVRLAAAAKLDEQIALDFSPANIPIDAWTLVVRAVVTAQRGPVGLPVGGGVLHVLFGLGAARIAALYFLLRSGALPFVARRDLRAEGLGRDCGPVLDAIDVWFARREEPEQRPDAPARREDSGMRCAGKGADPQFYREAFGGAFDRGPSGVFSADYTAPSVFRHVVHVAAKE